MREGFLTARNEFDGGIGLLDMPPQLCEVGAPGALYEQSSTLEDSLARPKERLVRELISVLDNVLLEGLSARSLSEFMETRKSAWPKYIHAVRALSDTLSNLLSKEAREASARMAITSLEENLERQEARFGDVLTDQAIFTASTIGRMRSLGAQITAIALPREMRKADAVLLSEYSSHAYWSSFHLDLMVAAMKFNRPMPEELREAVCEGLRAAVNAYAIMKEALFLRSPCVEEAPPHTFPWDEEDEQLLASSMRDLNANLSDDGDHSG
jgi:hypothetical protein